MKFHENLRALRKNSAYMQKELAAMIDVSTRAFQNYELGVREPNIETLVKIADLFGVTLDELVGRDLPK